MAGRRHFGTVLLALSVLGVLGSLTVGPMALAGHGGPDSGPFAGTVREGERDVHLFDNRPEDGACIAVQDEYTVLMRYLPPVDRLGLRVHHALGEESFDGVAGVGLVTFDSAWCTTFSIEVVGLQVLDRASYNVTVHGGHCGPAGCGVLPVDG